MPGAPPPWIRHLPPWQTPPGQTTLRHAYCILLECILFDPAINDFDAKKSVRLNGTRCKRDSVQVYFFTGKIVYSHHYPTRKNLLLLPVGSSHIPHHYPDSEEPSTSAGRVLSYPSSLPILGRTFYFCW